MTRDLATLLRSAESNAPRPNIRPIRLADLEVRARRRAVRRTASLVLAAASLTAILSQTSLRTAGSPSRPPPLDWGDWFAQADAALDLTRLDAVDSYRIRALEAARVRALIATARLDADPTHRTSEKHR